VDPSSENFYFPWPVIKVVIEGMSILDVPRLEVHSMEEATRFVAAYGFDPTSDDDMELIWRFFDESISFVEKSLGDTEYPKVPEHLKSRDSVKDIRRVLLMASTKEGGQDQFWCCAILRVMNVLIHLHYDPRLKFYDQMVTQVLTRLDQYIYLDQTTGATFLGRKEDGQGIKLLFFKKKDRKDRSREVIKLLHKSDSAVEEIYDRVGVRLVTESKLEALKAIRLLVERSVVSLPNIRPGRSRNRLIDLKRLQFEVDRVAAHIKKSGDSAPYVDKMIKRIERRVSYRRLGRGFMNPHSSEHYRAIQFTCRELVKISNPMHQVYERLAGQVGGIPGGNAVLQEVFPVVPQTHEYGFFPYEVQVMDVRAYADSIFGKSNHEEYRRKQLQAARDRVFGRGAERTI